MKRKPPITTEHSLIQQDEKRQKITHMEIGTNISFTPQTFTNLPPYLISETIRPSPMRPGLLSSLLASLSVCDNKDSSIER